MDNPEDLHTETQTDSTNVTEPVQDISRPPEPVKQPGRRNPFAGFRWRRIFNSYTAVILLLLICAALFALWRLDPQSPNSSDRTVKVTGEATITAEPDEYEFNPSYTFRNADKGNAIAAATAKQTEIVNQLKKIGVADKQIKNTLDGYEDYPGYYVTSGTAQTDSYVYTLSLTVTVPNRTMAQQVQDYLTTTNPEGSVTPTISFSDAAQKKLESQARDLASKDARSKADESARNLGFKVKNVKSVTDGTGFDDSVGGCGPSGLCNGVSLDTTSNASQSLGLQPGQDKYTFTVDVTYYIR